ncbi:MAG: glycan-binding surface protein [Bacteroidota bacterium]
MLIRRSPLLLLALLALAASGCVQFQPQQLYTGIEAAPVPERPRSLALAAEPIIYSDANDDQVWFQDDVRCTQGSLTEEVVFEGERAVAVSWDRSAEGCEWAGLGFGWDNWAGKNLSELLPYAAIQMRVRAAEGRMFGLPIVLTFEDYSGGMGFAYTDNKYFERPFIDEEWQQVTVPLADFDIEAPGAKPLDPTNVKQLMFELQQSGSVYLDDIQLAWYEPEPQEPWIVLPERPDPTALPITLFDDAFINNDGWGLIDDACQSAQIEPASGRGSVLRMAWDVRPDGCYEGTVGVSWDQWYPIDVTSITDRAAIEFDVRLASGTADQVPVRVALEDYGRQTSQIILDGRFTPSGRFTTDWQTVTIPFSALRGGGRELAAAPATVGDLPEFQDGANPASIKQLVFFLDDAGEILIDDLRLVALN